MAVTSPASTGITFPVAAGAGVGGGGTTTVIDAGGAEDISFINGAAIIWTNEPDADTELLAGTNRRKPANLAGRTSIQPYVGGTVSAGPGSVLICRYSLDGGSTWLDFTTPCSVATDNLGAAISTTIGTAVLIPTAAKRDAGVILTWFGNADSTPAEDPAFTTLGVLVV